MARYNFWEQHHEPEKSGGSCLCGAWTLSSVLHHYVPLRLRLFLPHCTSCGAHQGLADCAHDSEESRWLSGNSLVFRLVCICAETSVGAGCQRLTSLYAPCA